MDWASGYVADIDYTYHYYRELQPDLMRFACLASGVAPPMGDVENYLELGYGRGLSLNIHAAANSGCFWGTDFNPSHALEAVALATASGAATKLFDDSFAEMVTRPDLPQFDMIVMHGIWSWISPENQRLIVDFLRRKLRLGGLLYVSYNCSPGRSADQSLKHLISLHSELASAELPGSLGKVEQAIGFIQDVARADAIYFRQNPAVTTRLERLLTLDRTYVAHEYLAGDWTLPTRTEVAETFAGANLTFAASADILDLVDSVNLTAEGSRLLSGISHLPLRHAVWDYLVNKPFRRDIFVKGARRLSPYDQLEMLQTMSFVLTTSPDDTPLTIRGAVAEAKLEDRIYRPLIEALAETSLSPKTLVELSQKTTLRSLTAGQLMEALIVLMSLRAVSTARSPTAQTRNFCQALNRRIIELAGSRGEISSLASPVTGGGVTSPRVDQLFLQGLAAGRTKPVELASDAWQVMATHGHRLSRNGAVLTAAEDNIGLLRDLGQTFLAKRLPVLEALGVATMQRPR